MNAAASTEILVQIDGKLLFNGLSLSLSSFFLFFCEETKLSKSREAVFLFCLYFHLKVVVK